MTEPPFRFAKKEETNVTAYEEESATLHAVVNRDNASVQWLRNGEPITCLRFSATSDGCDHYLTVNPLQRSDAGQYTCDVGTDKINFWINIKGK